MESKGNVAHNEETKFSGSMELNKCHLQEHEPLHHLLSILPQKAQKGLSSLPIEYTCIDVSPEYIALGTSVGLVLLYDRLGQSMQRLNCKIKTEIITCVKLAESVDYVVAAGTQSGKVFVFQLPSLLLGRAKRMQLYCVSDVHFSQITCVEWSQNTLKLFSGDLEGCVACSEMDYAEQQSKSYIVAEEPHEIVQLDYAFKRLLVSTIFRSFLCTPGVSEKTRLGKKDRKVLGPFAACFKPELCRSEDATVFATRPGLRLWKADIEGNVQTTYMFKDLLSGNTPMIVLLPDTTHGHSTATIEEMTFGRLRAYSDGMLVTWHETTLFVLNPDRGTFVGWHSNLENIKGLSVCQDEIFILRDSPEGRKVIRIAQKRDLLNDPVSTKHIGLPTSSIEGQNQSSHSPVHILQQTATNLADAILGVGEKMKGVKEGHTPPWGLAGDPNAPPSPDLDSCKEVNSQSSGSSGVTSPDIEHSSHQPTILLDSPDTLTVILQEKDKTSTPTVDKPTISVKPRRSSGSTDAMGKLSSTDGFYSTNTKPHRSTYLSTISVEDDDIVFSPKLKKGRKKRIKSDKDKDTESIGSVDSSSVGIEGTPDLKLEYPEKYSVEQPEDTGAHQSQIFASTPDCGSTANGSSVGNEPDFQALADSAFEQPPSTRSENLECSNSLQTNTRSITSQRKVEISKPEESNSIQQQSTSPDLPIENCQMQKDRKLVAQPYPGVSDSPYSDLIERLISDNDNKVPEVENTSEPDPKDSNFLNEMIGDTADGFSGATEIIYDASDKHIKSQDTHLGKELNQSVSGNSSFSSKSKEPQQIYAASDSSTDDFYSKFKRGNSIVSPGWSPEEEPSIEEAIEKGEPTEILEAAARKDLQNRLADTWTEFLAPGNLVSICLTSRHIWCVDKSDRLHYSGLSGPGLKWRKVDEPAKQISVSRSGWIVWRLYNGSAYAGTAITPRAPAGMKWVEAARDVAFMAVDNTIAWYIKSNGEISVQKSISRERPSYRAQKVACQAKLLQVVCQDDVVWVVTEARSILVRMGIKAGTEEGTDWIPLNKEGADLVVSNLAFGDNGTAWVVDVVGRVWFTTGVRWDDPNGTGKWWQVSLSEYLMEDYKAVDTLKSLATFPQNLSKIIAKEKGGLMAVGSNGIWICPGSKHVLHVCRGGITGHRFNAVVPSGMATSAKWLNISAGAVDNDNGLIWAQQPNNAIFCFPSHNKKFSEVSHPEFSSPFVCISSTKEAVWGLLGDGRVVIRGGMAAHCPQGLNWISLDLIQLGSAKLVHLSCSTDGVWGVDNNGMVYLRIGIKPPGRGDHGYLNPAWVPVDGTTQGAGAKFNKVFAGPIDWMVWAIDTKKQVYARKGISDSMPIGTRWSYIPGTTAEKLCLSERYVYALNTYGEVLVRFGVSPDNPGGDYWKKVPGAFKEITATTQDDLWGINHDGQLCQRAVYYLQRQDVLEELSDGSVGKDSVGDDWELI